MDNYEVLTEEIIKNREEMQELLTEEFNTSALFAIYEKRDMLDRLFTPSILDMDRNKLYSSREVAEILDIDMNTLNNKRKEFVSYVNPEIIGKANSKNWKHDYTAVFKLKMIDGLTGKGGDFTLSQIKEIIYGNIPSSRDNVDIAPTTDNLLKLIKQYEETLKTYEQQVKLLVSDEFERSIKEMIHEQVQAATRSLPEPVDKEDIVTLIKNNAINREEVYQLLEDKFNSINTADDEEIQQLAKELKEIKRQDKEAREAVQKLYSDIISIDTSLEEKEEALRQMDELKETYPHSVPIIDSYYNLGFERVRSFAQEQRTLEIIKVKEKALELYQMYHNKTLSHEVRDNAYEKLHDLVEEQPDLAFEIKQYIVQIMLDKERELKPKKGFFARLFGK